MRKVRLALMGDVHGNHIALDTALRDARARGVDGVAFLGDYVSDMPEPQKTMRLLYDCARERPTWFIRGNREEYMLARRAGGMRSWRFNTPTGSLLYTYRLLTEADLDFFAAMPITLRIAPDGCPPFTVCHASPFRAREWLLDDMPRIAACAREAATPLLVCAHTHNARDYHLPGNQRVALLDSVGLSAQTHGLAHYLLATCDGSTWDLERLAPPYDAALAAEELRSSPLYPLGGAYVKAVRRTLLTDENANEALFRVAKAVARDEGIPLTDGLPPEACMQKAAVLIGLDEDG